jgi:hypothetical protein
MGLHLQLFNHGTARFVHSYSHVYTNISTPMKMVQCQKVDFTQFCNEIRLAIRRKGYICSQCQCQFQGDIFVWASH